jgi:S1-C subfamily serine protease
VIGIVIAGLLALPGPDSKPAGSVDAARRLARSSCVQVVSKSGTGSGVVIGVRGAFLYVLTASHVVAGSDRLEVHLPPVDKDAKAKVIADVDVLIDGKVPDVALLRVSAGDVKVTPLALAAEAPGGDMAFDAVSASAGENAAPDVRAERVLARKLLRRPDGETWFVWETRERPETGRSGGALIDSGGRLIGLCSGAQEGKGYYTHVDEIRALLKKKNQGWLLQTGGEKGKN